ncbi:MAG: PAS domain S-box protein [Deltaproteobacteria bacterium]|nr:PAS domain S-box protein [Deltaproteobacteria bacterium]
MKNQMDNRATPTRRERAGVELNWSAASDKKGAATQQLIDELRETAKEKNRITKALQVSETRYRSLVESTDDFIYLVNGKGEYLFMNTRTLSLYGLSPHEVTDKHYGDFHDEKETRIFMEQLRQVFNKKGSLVQEHPGKNGGYYLLTLSPVKEPGGAVCAVTVISKEITAHKKLETALIKTNERLRQEQIRRIALAKKLINLLEEERHRIAGDLHDQVGQVLTSLKMDLENLHSVIPVRDSALSEKISEMSDKASRVLGDIKIISSELRPAVLDVFGLERSLVQLLKELEQKGVGIDFFRRDIPERFHPEKELALYRIAQEATQNIMKHAKAQKVHVNFTRKKRTLSLSVEDNGVGFNPGKSTEFSNVKGALGLLIMQERAFQQGGELTIDSAEGKGTHILVEMPL